MGQCEYYRNSATREGTHNPHTDTSETLCEVHYAYLNPTSATVNPIDVGRCIRCGEKALDNDGRGERLIEPHVNYPLNITVPICDSCHAEIHSDDDSEYLKRYERQNSPYDSVGSKDAEGTAVHRKYHTKSRTGEQCPECDMELISPPDGMGFDAPHLCPNAECSKTGVTGLDLF